MFLYPALTIGFLFVAVPLLVHLINMLRHRRQKWAAMDFLLASYRKQKKWIRLRQLLLLLSRLAVAAVLIAMLCGWTGSRQMLGVLGGSTTHHVVILDDSYSMGDSSGRTTAYGRSLVALQNLTRQLANDGGIHELTVMRSSRAAMTVRGGNESGDIAADLSAQTITSDARLINRIMATEASPIRTDLVAAIDLAGELIENTPTDQTILYIASDFRDRDWAEPRRLAESLKAISADSVSIRMIDCAVAPTSNLAVTELAPLPDVWVAGVPVVVHATIRNYGPNDVNNVSVDTQIFQYPSSLTLADPTLVVSANVESLPTMVIESLAVGEEITKSFQVYIADQGTHAVKVSLRDDALSIDNSRVCTLPLSDAEKVLVIDGTTDGRGAYHVASVLDPGSQVRIGAIPDIKPPSFLRSATLETLLPYRAIYLIDVEEIGENVADSLDRYVRRGGGLAWFLGENVNADSYNNSLLAGERRLLPMPLAEQQNIPQPDSLSSAEVSSADVLFGEDAELLAPLQVAGDAALSMIGLSRSWTFEKPSLESRDDAKRPRMRTVLKRRDGKPLVTKHDVERGRVITVLTGLDNRWTNWAGDPTFVVFLLQANADLWSGAAASTQRFVDDPIRRTISLESYAPEATFLPASNEPPRIPLEVAAQTVPGDANQIDMLAEFSLDPNEMVISGESNISDVLRPGVGEWSLVRSDGQGEVAPVASVIRDGEGDLRRIDAASIQQELMPLEVKFIDSEVWNNETQTAGSSTLALVLLGLLGLLLAIEQVLAYWASYHTKTIDQSSATAKQSFLKHRGPFSVRAAR
ncbi:BatA domain-containing protein [Novipirellula aureliae]|nr:BatA domain-containing protein [Novipirellula aureliae]